jgi:hypothetical protein
MHYLFDALAVLLPLICCLIFWSFYNRAHSISQKVEQQVLINGGAGGAGGAGGGAVIGYGGGGGAGGAGGPTVVLPTINYDATANQQARTRSIIGAVFSLLTAALKVAALVMG